MTDAFDHGPAPAVPVARTAAQERRPGPGVTVLAGPTAPQEIATAMHAAWVAFAKSGDPGWAAYNTDTRTTRRFATDGPETVDDPRGDRVARHLRLLPGLRRRTAATTAEAGQDPGEVRTSRAQEGRCRGRCG